MKERIYALCEALGITPNAFSVSLGLCRTFAKSMSGATSSSNVARILSTYPQVNPYWLLLGEGEMFLTRVTKNIDYKELYQAARRDNEDLRRDNQRLRNEIDRILATNHLQSTSTNG